VSVRRVTCELLAPVVSISITGLAPPWAIVERLIVGVVAEQLAQPPLRVNAPWLAGPQSVRWRPAGRLKVWVLATRISSATPVAAASATAASTVLGSQPAPAPPGPTL